MLALHHGGVTAELTAEDDLFLPGLIHQYLVQVCNNIVAVLFGQLDQCRVMGHRPIKRDTAEDPPHDGIPDLFGNYLVAQLVAVFQVHDPKVGLHRERSVCRLWS